MTPLHPTHHTSFRFRALNLLPSWIVTRASRVQASGYERGCVCTYITSEPDLPPDPQRNPLRSSIRFIPMAEQVEILHELNKAIDQMSLTALSNVMHPDVVHVTLPQSVNIPKRNKAQNLEYYGKMFDNWTSVGTVSHLSSR